MTTSVDTGRARLDTPTDHAEPDSTCWENR